MEIMEIIKDAFTFPANNLKALGIYILILFVVGILSGIGIALSTYAQNNLVYLIIGLILVILAIIVGFALTGYELDIVKSGVNQDNIAPGINIKEDFVRGIKAVIVGIVYFIIPAIITVIVAFIANVPQNVVDLAGYLNQTVPNANGTVVASTITQMVPQDVLANLGASIGITAIVAAIFFIIFGFFHFIANARLANTDSLAEALNIPETFRDFTKIGVVKVIAVVILLCIIIAIITGILSFIYDKVPVLSIINILVTPFIMFVINRANGLLYSDIA